MFIPRIGAVFTENGRCSYFDVISNKHGNAKFYYWDKKATILIFINLWSFRLPKTLSEVSLLLFHEIICQIVNMGNICENFYCHLDVIYSLRILGNMYRDQFN